MCEIIGLIIMVLSFGAACTAHTIYDISLDPLSWYYWGAMSSLISCAFLFIFPLIQLI